MAGAAAKDRQQKLQQHMQKLGIHEDDLVEKFVLGTGSGGQKINKTSSCVYLHHLPTGIEIKCQRTRFRELNRYYARFELCDRIEKIRAKEAGERQKEKEKKRRQNRQPTRLQKAKMVEVKRHLSKKKKWRKSFAQED